MGIRRGASTRTRKIVALAAGMLVMGVGASYTLASWNDSEWVWGGADSDPGVGTSKFNIQQDTTVAFNNDAWLNKENNPGGELTFTTGALTLSPGDTVYAPVALRTDATSVAAEVTLQAAVAATGITVADTGGALWNALELEVFTNSASTSPFGRAGDCNAKDTADSTKWSQVAGVTNLSTGAAAAQNLGAASASVQHYCFAITLPAGADNSLQGHTIAPAWEFNAVSQ